MSNFQSPRGNYNSPRGGRGGGGFRGRGGASGRYNASPSSPGSPSPSVDLSWLLTKPASPPFPQPKSKVAAFGKQMEAGKDGNITEIVTNYFHFNVKPSLVYQYDLEVRKAPEDLHANYFTATGDQVTSEEFIEDFRKLDASFEAKDHMDQPKQTRNTGLMAFLKKVSPTVFSSFVSQLGERIFERNGVVYDGHKVVYTSQKLKEDFYKARLATFLPTGQKQNFEVTLKLVATSNSVINLGNVVKYYESCRNNDNSKTSFSPAQPVSPDVIRFLDTAFRHVLNGDQALIPHNHTFYTAPASPSLPSSCLICGGLNTHYHGQEGKPPASDGKFYTVVSGFAPSARMTESGPAVNIHLKTSVMLKPAFAGPGSLVCLVKAIGRYLASNGSQVNGPSFTLEALIGGQSYLKSLLDEINRFLHSMEIVVEHGKAKRIYNIDCLLPVSPYEYMITLGSMNNNKGTLDVNENQAEEEPRQQLMAEYFQEAYNIWPLQAYPIVKTAGKNGPVFPLEMVSLRERQFLADEAFDVGGSSGLALHQAIKDELIAVSCRKPEAFFFKMVEAMGKLVAAATPYLSTHFGIDLYTTAPMRVLGRTLPPPTYVEQPNKMIVKRWLFLYGFDSSKSVTEKAIREVFLPKLKSFEASSHLEFDLKGVKVLDVGGGGIAQLESNLREVLRPYLGKVSFVFALMPVKHHQEVYKATKAICDIKYGLPSSFLSGAKFKQFLEVGLPAGYWANFLRKVHSKVGGKALCRVDDFVAYVGGREGPNLRPVFAETMIMGVDVNHPGKLDSVRCSIAAAVGYTRGPEASASASGIGRFTTVVVVQEEERLETVTELPAMMRKLLKGWMVASPKDPKDQKNRKMLPENLFIFRDGVSEGQFEKVLQHEVAGINELYRNFRIPQEPPKITLVVVQKGHHSRFMLTKDVRGSYNLPAGTVVDCQVVEPYLDSFILASHRSPLGTTCPAKYIVLLNQMALSPDQLHRFCLLSCQNSPKTTQTLAIPIFVALADQAAYRAKDHLDGRMLIEGVGVNGSLPSPRATPSTSNGRGQGQKRKSSAENEAEATRRTKIARLNKLLEPCNEKNSDKLYYL